MGVLWTLLEPLLTMMVLVLVFSKLYHNTKDFPVYILTVCHPQYKRCCEILLIEKAAFTTPHNNLCK